MLSSIKQNWFSNIRGDLLAGIVVALALIPEAIAFSIIAGVDPKIGLYASFCIAVVIAFVGGRPGMISAATGAMALLIRQGDSIAIGLHFGIDGSSDDDGAGYPHCRRYGRATGYVAGAPVAGGASQFRDTDDHLPVCSGAGRRRPARIDDDGDHRR
jgi:hypothetical protein